MKILMSILIFALITLQIVTANAAGEKILFISSDDRPVSLKQPVEVVKQLGYEIIAPPKEFLNVYKPETNSDNLWAWLDENISNANAVVVSSDALLYGGLIPSRKHNIDESTLNARVNRFKSLREKNPALKIYVVSSLMRTPQVGTKGDIEEPEYYAEHGANIFNYTALLDKSETSKLTSKEQNYLKYLESSLPSEILTDWFTRREKNLSATKQLIDMTQAGIISYLVIGRDDNSPLSQTHRENLQLKDYAAKVHLDATKFQSLAGIDEFGMLLLTRAVNDLRGESPKIFVDYNKGVGAKTIPAFSDEQIGNSIKSDVEIVGGQLVNKPIGADVVLLVNTDPKGKTHWGHNDLPHPHDKKVDYNAPRKDTKYFVDMVENYVNKGYPVSIADITFANGADNPMMNLMKERGLLYKIQAYSGWNTATNSAGFVLGTGILARHMSDESKDKLLTLRYLEDWGYQANVRTIIGAEIFNTRQGGVLYYQFDGKTLNAEKRIKTLLKDFADKNLPPFKFLRKIKITCPWNRMFEIDITFKE